MGIIMIEKRVSIRQIINFLAFLGVTYFITLQGGTAWVTILYVALVILMTFYLNISEILVIIGLSGIQGVCISITASLQAGFINLCFVLVDIIVVIILYFFMRERKLVSMKTLLGMVVAFGWRVVSYIIFYALEFPIFLEDGICEWAIIQILYIIGGIGLFYLLAGAVECMYSQKKKIPIICALLVSYVLVYTVSMLFMTANIIRQAKETKDFEKPELREDVKIIENSSQENSNLANELIGVWEIDTDKTMSETNSDMIDLFGTAFFDYGSEAKFKEDGSFSYYVGIGCGAAGSYEISGNEVVYDALAYESNSREVGTIIVDDSDINNVRLIMQIYGNDIYWKK